MRRLFLFFSFFCLFYFTIGFYFATFPIDIFGMPSEKTKRSHPIYHDYRGVSHVVTNFSKGSKTPANILLEAGSAGLNFLIFTDLNLMDRPYRLSGYNGDVFTFSNQKISYLDSHILVYTDNPDFHFNQMTTAHAQLQQHFSEPGSTPGFMAVLAHPFKKSHLWVGEYPPGLDGIEVINLRHLWQQTWFKNRLSFFWSIIIYPFNPELALLRLIGSPDRELRLWDTLNKSRPTLGFLGNETTAKIFRVFGLNFTFPSYQKSFEFASNHLLLPSELTGHVPSDRRKIYGAIRDGQFYFSFDSMGNPAGFATYLKRKRKTWPLGSKTKLQPGMSLHIDLPKGLKVPFRIKVYKDGELLQQSKSEKVELPIKLAGTYRVEVEIQPSLPWPDEGRWFGWIYTNPIFVN